MFQLNEGQLSAIHKAIEWYYNPNKKPSFFLCGYAGTGKSSCAKTIVKMLGLSPYQVVMVTFTGKAASVLRSKGNVANTIHSMFYRVFITPDGKTAFAKKKTIPNTIKLILVDEVSMVNQRMQEDLESFGVPLLCLGDSGQLPALFYPNLGVDNPDAMLTQIMRQKGDSGILQLATMARNDIPIPYGQYKESKVIRMSEVRDIEKYDMVLCWSNSTRKEINALIRKKLGLTSIYPSKGEKIVCLKNNYTYELDCGDDMLISPVNGLEMTALTDAREPRTDEENQDYMVMEYAPDFIKDKTFSTPISKIPYEAYKTMEPYEDRLIDVPQFQVVTDYYYCSTVHKSQGSSWPNVLVIDEFKGPRDDYKKWLYTAITRAEQCVTIARFV